MSSSVAIDKPEINKSALLMSSSDRSRLIVPAINAAAVEVFGEKFCGEFGEVLKKLLKEGRAHDFIKYCYAGDGEDKWDDVVTWGHLSRYTIPSDEATLIHKSKDLIARLFSPLKPFGIIAGGGNAWAVLHKEIPTHRAAMTSEGISWDFNKKSAENGAAYGSMELNIKIQAVVGDFREGLPNGISLLDSGAKTFLLTLYGSTLTQFAKTGSPSLQDLLASFGKTTNYNGFIIGTLDGNQSPRNVESCYSGEHFTAWQEEVWNLTKSVTGDNDFEPKYIKYRPRYNPETLSLEHVHEVIQSTSIRTSSIEKPTILERGEEFIVGVSQKWGAKDIVDDCHKGGWDQFLVLRNGSSVCAVGYVGKNTPMDVREQVQQALNEMLGHDLVVWHGSVTKPNITLQASPT